MYLLTSAWEGLPVSLVREGIAKVHIAHCISSLGPGGAETLVRDLSLELVAMGHEVSIVSVSSNEKLGIGSEFEDQFRTLMESKGVNLYEIGHLSRKIPLYGAVRFRKLMNLIQPDIVHHHLQWTLLFDSLSFLKIPSVYTHHLDRFVKGEKIFRLVARKTKNFIGISSEIGTMLREMKVAETTVIPNAIKNRFAFIDTDKPRNGPFRTISIGSIAEQKNYPLLVEVVEKILNENQNAEAEFVIVGGGPQFENLKKLIEDKSLEKSIKLMGVRSDIPQLLAESDMYLLTSAWEGLPISLIEAAMAGLPIVATNVGSCDEVVKHEKNGFLVAGGDAESLARSVSLLMSDANLRKKMGAKSKVIGKGFQIGISTNHHLDLYNRVLTSRRV